MIELLDTKDALTQGTGKGVIIAVLDTGIDATHPFFAKAHILPQIEFDETLVAREVEAHDSVGHGTAIAGIIHRLAPKATLLPIRVLTSGPRQSRHQLIHQGALEAIKRKAQILNCSFGAPATAHTCLLYKQWVDLAFDNDSTIVTASSNLDSSIDEWPSAFRTTLATTYAELEAAQWLVRKGSIPFAAAGHDIEVPIPGGGTSLRSGSSFAAAHLTSMIARLLSSNPNLSPSALREILTHHAKQKPSNQVG